MLNVIRAICALFVVTLLSACGGGGGSPGTTSSTSSSLFTTAPDSIMFQPNETKTYTIGGGVPSYTANNSNNILTVSVSGNTLTLKAVGTGTSSLAVKDSKGNSVVIAVTVGTGFPLFTSAPSSITLFAGSSSDVFTIGGGSPGTTVDYRVTSDNLSVAQVAKVGKQFIINGYAAGTAKINVTDALGGSVTISVTVAGSGGSLYTTAPSNLTISTAMVNGISYNIIGGSPPYTVTPNNTTVLQVSSSGSTFTVTGIAAGVSDVVIRDSTGGTPVTVTVTVVAPASSDVQVSPSSVTANVSDVVKLYVYGGKPPYSVVNSVNSVATVSPTSLSTAGTVDARLINTGQTLVTVTDANGKVLAVPILVEAVQNNLRIAPNALSISELYEGTVVFTVDGGSLPYTIYSSDTNFANVSISVVDSGNTFSVDSVGVKGRCSSPATLDKPYNIVLTAVDSKGKSATTTLTIIDSGSCP